MCEGEGAVGTVWLWLLGWDIMKAWRTRTRNGAETLLLREPLAGLYKDQLWKRGSVTAQHLSSVTRAVSLLLAVLPAHGRKSSCHPSLDS